MSMGLVLLMWELPSNSLPLSNKIILSILLGVDSVGAAFPVHGQTLSDAGLDQNQKLFGQIKIY